MPGEVKCSRCSFRGEQTEFPLKSCGGYLKSCAECALKAANKEYAKRHSTDVGHAIKTRRRRVQDRMPGDTPTLNWEEFLNFLRQNKECAFELHATVELDFEEPSKESGDVDAPQIARIIAYAAREQTGYRFNYKKKTASKNSDHVKVYTYYCAQLEGEQTKQRLHEDGAKRRARTTMDRYKCYGWLHITLDDRNLSSSTIRITHHQSHHPYTDIETGEVTVRVLGRRRREDSPEAEVIRELKPTSGVAPRPNQQGEELHENANVADLKTDKGALVGFDDEEGNEGERVFISAAEKINLEQRMCDIMAAVEVGATHGMHPKLATRLLPALEEMDLLGRDVGEYKRKRLNQRTYTDTNKNTMYID